MRIKQITISASHGFNDPFEQYANHKPSVTITAELTEGEDADKAIADLQAKASDKITQERKRIHAEGRRHYDIDRLKERLPYKLMEVENSAAQLKGAQERNDDGVKAYEARAKSAARDIVKQKKEAKRLGLNWDELVAELTQPVQPIDSGEEE